MAHNYTHPSTTARQLYPIHGKEHLMEKNNADGYSFKINKWKLLQRFLILGTEGGTYYVSEIDLTKTNVQNILDCIYEDELKVLELIQQISNEGRAIKNDPAIFVLALLMTHGSQYIRSKVANDNIVPMICRTGTHLFTYVHYINELRGWGRSVRKSIASWYNAFSINTLAYQLVKYKRRTVTGSKNKWTHKDVLKLAHVKPITDEHNELYKYILHKTDFVNNDIIIANNKINDLAQLYKNNSKEEQHAIINKIITLIQDYKIPHDSWPTTIKNIREVWEIALPDIPLTALIRNLAKITSLGIFDSKENIDIVIRKLSNKEYIKATRIHPFQLLVAYNVYEREKSIFGKQKWKCNKDILQALHDAIYLSFKNVIPTNKRYCLAIDVSSSMSWNFCNNKTISCAYAAAAMSLITKKIEKNVNIMVFSHKFHELTDIKDTVTINELYNKLLNYNFGATDCSLPMIWAMKHKKEFDVFIVYTDNETYYGKIHPSIALMQYRQQSGIDAKLIVVGMVSNKFSIADPTDPGMLDVIGFDTSTPQAISEFILE